MNKWKNLENCIHIVKKYIGGDEAEDIIYFLNEYKRLKSLELKGRL